MASKTPKICCWSLDVEAPKSAADSANTLTNSHMRAVRPESGLTRVSAKELKVGKQVQGGKESCFTVQKILLPSQTYSFRKLNFKSLKSLRNRKQNKLEVIGLLTSGCFSHPSIKAHTPMNQITYAHTQSNWPQPLVGIILPLLLSRQTFTETVLTDIVYLFEYSL